MRQIKKKKQVCYKIQYVKSFKHLNVFSSILLLPLNNNKEVKK